MPIDFNLLKTLAGHSYDVNAVAFSRDGSRMASGGGDKSVRVWDVANQQQILMADHGEWVNSVAFAPSGQAVVSGGRDGAVKLWSAENAQLLGTIQVHQQNANSVAFSPDGRRLASGGADGRVRIINLREKRIEKDLLAHTGWVWRVAFSSLGDRLVSCGGDRQAKIWSVEAEAPPITLAGHTDDVLYSAFSPDDRLVATAGKEGSVRVWDSDRGQQLFQFQAHDGAANCVAFSADGLHLATAGADHLIRVWFVQTGEMVKELSGHQDYVSAVAFSRDGKRMASCGGDGTVKIWEVTEKSAYASASSLDPGLEIEHEDTGRASLAYSSTYTAGKPVAEGTLKSGPTITLVQSGGDRVAFTAGDSTKPVVTITPNEVTVLGGPGLPYLTLAVDTLTVTFDKTDGAAAPLAGEKHEAEAGGADPNLEIERGGNEPVAGATQGLEIELETAAAPDRRYQAFERHGQALAREPIGRSGHIVRFVRFDTNTLYALLDQHEHPTLVFRGDLLDVRDGSGTTVFRMNVRSMEPVITRRSPVAAEGAAAQRPADPLVVAGVNEMVDRTPEPRMHRILSQAVWAKASDIHVPSGARVMVRKHGRLTGLGDKVYTASEVEALIYEILTPDQRQRFSETNDLDFSYEVPKLARFRANVLRQHRGVDATFRVIPDAIPSPEALGLPASVAPLCKHHNGLVLITGPAGQGKSTTIATLIDLINSEKAHHIITVEDPIEFVHPIKRAVVNQREVGRHTRSFANALRAALREDPDVIVVGEMRDLETISLAITASETGHLVFGSLMTSGAAQTIDRILDSFPSGQQAQIRTMLSESLRGVVSQQLVPTIDGEGRVLACEVLLGTPAVANMIRERKTFQLPSIMQTGRTLGMLRMDDSLFEHFSSGRISADAAITYSQDPKAAEARIRPKAGGAPAAEPAVPTPRSR